jgi:hypothetical protein
VLPLTIEQVMLLPPEQNPCCRAEISVAVPEQFVFM